MGEQTNDNTEGRINLPDERADRFKQIEQVAQEQVVFDAWRRTLQDWRHARPEDWAEIDLTHTNGRDITVEGWEVETIGTGVPDVDEIRLDYRGVLTGLDTQSEEEFLSDVADHMAEIIDTRFTN